MAQTKKARQEAAKKAARTRAKNRKAEQDRKVDPEVAASASSVDEAVSAGKSEDEVVAATEARKKAGGESQVKKFENNNPEYGGDAEYPDVDERMVDAARAGADDARNLSGDKRIKETKRSQRGQEVAAKKATKATKELKEESGGSGSSGVEGRAPSNPKPAKAKAESKPKDVERTVEGHRFPPGTAVQVHEGTGVEQQANRLSPGEPTPKAGKTAKVGKDGSLSFKAPKGQYVLAGNAGTEKEPNWLYLHVAVK